MLKKIVHSLVHKLRNNTIAMSDIAKTADTAITSVSSDVEMKDLTTSAADKRSHDNGNEGAQDEQAAKKMKLENTGDGPSVEEPYKPFKKKKMVMFLVYSGKGYLGMQRNPGARTIESDLVEALLKAGVVNEEHAANPGSKMHFQRAARTDKGVSAAGQICSLNMFIDVENAMEKINSHLVDQIRVIGLQKATKKFDSKNAANARTYMYMLPTFAFTPCEQFVLETFKIDDETHRKVNETLALYKGTRNFHNFTSGKKPTDPSARRYIIDFSMGPSFVRDGIEFAVITVKGQSFMLHQIRKMIGLTIAIVRGLTGPEAVERAYGHDKCDIPKAPGLGLVLDRVHYDFYNKKYGTDGLHEPIAWEKYQETIDKFKEEYIYRTIIETEREERSMLKWMSTLHLHKFEPRTEDDQGSIERTRSPISQAQRLVNNIKESILEQGESSDKVMEDEVKVKDNEVKDTDNEVKVTDDRSADTQLGESTDPPKVVGGCSGDASEPVEESWEKTENLTESTLPS